MILRTVCLALSLLIIMAISCLAVEPIKQINHCSITENQMLGYWESDSDNGFFEEFLLDLDETQHTFSSWLHHRPEVNGTWSFNNCVFQVFGPMSFTFRVVSLTDKKLTLINEDENTTSVYRWNGK